MRRLEGQTSALDAFMPTAYLIFDNGFLTYTEFYKLNWPQPPEFVGESEFLMLKATWEPLLTADLAYLLFPTANSSGAGCIIYVM